MLCFSSSHCTLVREAFAPPPSDVIKESDLANRELRLRNDIITYARQLLGKPYRDAGKTPAQGFDCSGFTSYVFDKFNIDLASSSRGQAAQGITVAIAKAKPGDLIFFRRKAEDPIFHVALVVANSKSSSLEVIHSTSRGVVIDNIMASDYWKPKIDSVRDVVSGTP